MNFFERLFPKHCLSCQTKGSYICIECAQKLVRHKEICPVCHQNSDNFQVCTKCKNKVFYEGIYIFYNYRGIIKKLIFNLKYLHLYGIGKDLSQLMITNFMNKFNKNKTIITYVPSHRIRKYFVKGYNQSEILADNFAQNIGFIFKQLVKKTKHTQSQTKLKRNQRLDNLKGCFEICSDSGLKGNENIIIIDDVTTTGSTINEIAKTLKTAYPKLKIRGMVLARNDNGF